MQEILLPAVVICRPFVSTDKPGRRQILAVPGSKRGGKLQLTKSQKGFGETSQGKKKQRKGSSYADDQSWTSVAKESIFQGKQIKAVEVKNKTILALYNIDGRIYCSDANSTAYQFPLTNGKILQREGGPAVEVALDGTIYDLTTGKVLEWCPRNNPFRAVLGTLKGSQQQKNLNVYPAKLDEESGQIFVQLDS